VNGEARFPKVIQYIFCGRYLTWIKPNISVFEILIDRIVVLLHPIFLIHHEQGYD